MIKAFFEPTSKRRRGFPSETNVKRGLIRMFMVTKFCMKSWGAMIPVHATPAAAFKKCCLKTGCFRWQQQA